MVVTKAEGCTSCTYLQFNIATMEYPQAPLITELHRPVTMSSSQGVWSLSEPIKWDFLYLSKPTCCPGAPWLEVVSAGLDIIPQTSLALCCWLSINYLYQCSIFMLYMYCKSTPFCFCLLSCTIRICFGFCFYAYALCFGFYIVYRDEMCPYVNVEDLMDIGLTINNFEMRWFYTSSTRARHMRLSLPSLQ